MSFPATYEHEHPTLTPAVRALIAITLAIAFLHRVVYDQLATSLAFDFNALPGHWWSAVTYLFGQASPWHLAVNMYALYLFGPRLEHDWGSRKFTAFYLFCGLGGVAFELLFVRSGALVGASAAVFGVMIAYAMQWADEGVYFLVVLPVRVRSLVAGLVVFDVVMGVMGGGTADGANLGYVAHLGGAIAAYIYMRMSMASGMDQVRQRVANLPDADEPPRAIPRNLPRRERGDEVDDIVAKSKAIAAKRMTSLAPAPLRREGRAEELNRVLDKISEQGIESLTGDERSVLEEMSRRLRDR